MCARVGGVKTVSGIPPPGMFIHSRGETWGAQLSIWDLRRRRSVQEAKQTHGDTIFFFVALRPS